MEALSAKEQKKRSQDIDKMLRNEKKKMAKQTTLLMLGSGQSGKSTFCKQMKILHMFGFSEREKQNYKAIIHTNIIDSTLDLIHAAHQHSLNFSDSNVDALGHKLYDAYRVKKNVAMEEIEVSNMHVKTYAIDESLAAEIQEIWNDAATDSIIKQAKELVVLDSIPYYLKKLDEIVSSRYEPNNVDILLARLRTTAVSETTFEHAGVNFNIIDVGGQKGERSKWLPLFSDVTAIIYCVSSSDYDLVLEEDGVTNRMIDSFELFKTIAKHRAMRHVPIILFLNKKDLFEKKIKEVDLATCFPEYKGGKNYKPGIKFLEQLFLKAGQEREGEVYVHVTQATDTTNVEVVWQAVKSILLRDALDALGGFGGSV